MTAGDQVVEKHQEDLRIKALMDMLMSSKVVPDYKKRDLSGDLQYAEAINGDPAQQTNKRMLLAGVSREIESYERHEDLKSELASIVTTALDSHTKNCVFVLMKARAEEEAKRRQAAEAVAAEHKDEHKDEHKAEPKSSLKIGKYISANGAPAIVFALVVAMMVVLGCFASWQNSKTRELIKDSLNTAVQEALSAK